ncbi:MAG: PDR/VanB family oxidoreductase [Mycobacterium sp.]
MADGRLLRRAREVLRPYGGEPPESLYRTGSPDLLIRIVGTVVPHFLSVVMRLGGDAELPEPPVVPNRRTMVVTRRRLVATDDDVVELTLAPLDGGPVHRWHPGAHIDVQLPSGRIRQYSLCGEPDARRQYRIAVRRIACGGGGSIEMHLLDVGHTIDISAPRNAFMMPLPGSASRTEKVHFIAGGIGITPLLPMARLAASLGVPWSMCYTGRHRASMPFLDELEALGGDVWIRTDAEHGIPSAAELLAGSEGNTSVFVCGPPPMIELVRRTVDEATELHVERFSPLPVADGAVFDMELVHTGQVVQVAGDRSALAALRDARPNISYSCRQGFCGTCVQRVIAGEVDHRDHLLTETQRKSGQMLVCVSRGNGRLVLDV